MATGEVDRHIPTKNLKAVKKTKLYEQIVTQLQDLIETGRYKHGDRLPPERELASIFQVSRHSVREAIRILEEKHSLETRLGSGTFIVTEEDSLTVDLLAKAILVEKDKLIEIFQFRKMIEPQIAALAAENATGDDIFELEKTLNEQKQALDNNREYLKLDNLFHLTLAKATYNSILVNIIKRINGILSKTRAEFSQSLARRQKSYSGHVKIIDAIKKRKAKLASDAMSHHIKSIEEIVLQLKK
jgi:GntR family transcriptional repressor for pyruvate dehydrogenase complex